MATITKLMVGLGMDTSEYDKGMDNAEKRAKTFSTNLGSTFKGVGGNMQSIGNSLSQAFTQPLMDLGRMLMKNEELRKSVEPIQTAFAGVSDKLAIALVPVIEKLTPSIISFANALAAIIDKFSEMDIGAQSVIVGLIAIVGVIGPVVGVIGGAIAAIGAIIAGIGIAAFGLIAALGALVGAIVIFGQQAWESLKGIMAIIAVSITLVGLKIQELITKFTEVATSIKAGFVQAVKDAYNWLDGKLRPAFDGIGKAIKSVIDWVGKLIDKFKSIKIPAWLTPGSPTPFEIGLVGIGKQMQKLTNSTLPRFSTELELVPQPLSGVAAGVQPSLASQGVESGYAGPSANDIGRALVYALQQQGMG